MSSKCPKEVLVLCAAVASWLDVLFCLCLPNCEGKHGNFWQLKDGRQRFDPSEVTLAVTSRDPECIDVVSPKSHYDVLARILLLYAKLNRGVRYVQGMNELCAPLYYLFAQDPLNFQHAEETWHKLDSVSLLCL